MFVPAHQGFRPLQLYHFAAEGVHCETLMPAAGLADRVYYHWLLHVDTARCELEVIPDNALDLVISPVIPDFAALYFPTGAPFVIPLEGPIVYAGSSFRAETATGLFPMDLATLRALEPGIGTVRALGLEDLVTTVQGMDTLADIGAALEDFISARFSRPPSSPLIGAMEHLLSHLEPSGVNQVARTIGVSERQLRRLTSDLMGLSPKKIQRVLRLQLALGELFSPDAPVRREGFYDDSHLIRELKAMTGLTPGQLRRVAEKYNPDEG